MPKECDLVMKGGITSGVVYPKLVTQLAKEYQFKRIGGTSAGSIAAGLTAAAEFQRKTQQDSMGGFGELDALPAFLGDHLEDLFQPNDRYKKLFRWLLKQMKSKPSFSFWFVIRSVRIFFRIKKAIKQLPKTDYGFCSGRTQQGYKTEGLTDWLNKKIEQTAGRMLDGQLPATPLTFGMLEKEGIELRTITTNLSQSTPVTLPNIGVLWIKREDLIRLFPENIAAYVESVQPQPIDEPTDGREDITTNKLLRVPVGDEMPVLLGMRLSLSFPILISAIPFYRIDQSLRLCKSEQKKPQLCWFSDGGICSNFPIHLFDNPLPQRPTFGITLGKFDACRQDPDIGNQPGKNRTYLPVGAKQGMTSAITAIDDLFGFAGAIFNAASTWQDINQTVLPGYRERIVRLYLNPDEGGLNLNMPPEKIASLARIGEAGGKAILESFNFNDHRWRRLLSAYAAIEESLASIERNYDPDNPQGMHAFLQLIRSSIKQGKSIISGYMPNDVDDVDELIRRMDEFCQTAKKLNSPPIREQWGENGYMPRPRASLRIVPKKQID